MKFLMKIGYFQNHLSTFDDEYENFEFKIFCKFSICIGGRAYVWFLMMYEFMTNKILYLQFSK